MVIKKGNWRLPECSLTAEEALRQAAAEGLTLQRNDGSKSGFHRVTAHESGTFRSAIRRDGETKHLGAFATAEEAALAFARDVAANGPAGFDAWSSSGWSKDPHKDAPPPMTAEEAMRAVEAEGLTLHLAPEISSGYRGVIRRDKSKTKPWYVQVSRNHTQKMLGSYVTKEEAALAYARDIAQYGPTGLSASQKALAVLAERKDLTAEEALQQAEAEGLTLERNGSKAGYRGVATKTSGNQTRPYSVRVERNGAATFLGNFATPEEAALVYARETVCKPTQLQKRRAANPLPPMLTAEEALQEAEAEGLTLVRTDGISGFKWVQWQDNYPSGPYRASFWLNGKTLTVGHFKTGEEAALTVARYRRDHNVVPIHQRDRKRKKPALNEKKKKPALQAVASGAPAAEKRARKSLPPPEKSQTPSLLPPPSYSGPKSQRLQMQQLQVQLQDESQPSPMEEDEETDAEAEDDDDDDDESDDEGDDEGDVVLEGRFEELEECRERGCLTEEEYEQKRAMLLAASKTAPAAAKATKKPETAAIAPAPVSAPVPAPAPSMLPAPASALLPVPLRDLSVAQVGELLHRLGLGKYAEAFAEFPVDGACLVVADAADLEEAGMGPAMHRKKFLAALAELMAA